MTDGVEDDEVACARSEQVVAIASIQRTKRGTRDFGIDLPATQCVFGGVGVEVVDDEWPTRAFVSVLGDNCQSIVIWREFESNAGATGWLFTIGDQHQDRAVGINDVQVVVEQENV